jgi:FMN phosphatase YigB (HAD superfamily)
MLKAILLDLDDTLLVNPMSKFIPAYFEALTLHFQHLIPPERLVPGVGQAVKAMENNDGLLTNEEVFAKTLCRAVDRCQSKMWPMLKAFFGQGYPKLASLTSPAAGARELVQTLFSNGVPTVVATNPFYPMTALEQRLEWANVPPSEFAYSLITGYEIMHWAKPHPAYYLEIATRLDLQPDECLMVGDDWARDMKPASQAGMSVFWITDQGEEPNPGQSDLLAAQDSLLGQGSIADVWEAFRSVAPFKA